MSFKIGEQTHQWALTKKHSAFYLSTLTSTNDVAKDDSHTIPRLQHLNDLHLVLCEEQTLGRGRGKNNWLNSEPGTSLLSSWIFSLPSFPKPVLSIRIGYALYKSLKQAWPQIAWSLKAPNDIYIKDKKVAGILIESIQQNSEIKLIIGLGLNVFSSPKTVSSSTYIQQHANDAISLNKWHVFLDEFSTQLISSLALYSENLSKDEAQQIIEGLNCFPMLNEKYLDLTTEGSLITATKKINWDTL